jgi:glycosyltransferase involved in cell wall biosynthesis
VRVSVVLPLVSVGIPTFNRAEKLARAVGSVLAQDYPHLEVVICDNASEDATESLCRSVAATDDRVVYHRQAVNQGAHDNFLDALRRSRGDFFMWLGDDDWLPDPRYIGACMSFLADNPTYSLACGAARYYRGGSQAMDGMVINLADPSPAQRVKQFFSAVGDNATFYGVMRRAQVLSVGCPRVLGGDWLLVAAMAFLGKVKTLDDVALCREYTWDETRFDRITEQEGLGGISARFPVLSISLAVLGHIGWRSPVYNALGARKRLLLGLRCQWLALRRHSLPLVRDRLVVLVKRLLPGWVLSQIRRAYHWWRDRSG